MHLLSQMPDPTDDIDSPGGDGWFDSLKSLWSGSDDSYQFDTRFLGDEFVEPTDHGTYATTGRKVEANDPVDPDEFLRNLELE